MAANINFRVALSGPALKVVFIAIPTLLFIPVFYYSLTTPFALVDDYFDWTWVEVFESPRRFSHWFYERFLTLEGTGNRYRPFFEFYNMLAWKILDPTPWLHHLSRWILHFAAIFAFSAAFLSFPRARLSPVSQLIPLAILVYIWLFFPNSPASRLAPQEVYTVLFLALCNWMMALMLIGRDSGRGPFATIRIHSLFFLGFLGLALSKETNIAVMAWILAFYWVVLFWKKSSRWVLAGIPLIVIFLHMLVKVSQARGYGPTERDAVTAFYYNSREILIGLSQIQTSVVISVGFMTLCVFLLHHVVAKSSGRRFDAEFYFIIFLLGQAASIFLILAVSWGVTLRYWYVLIPIYTSLMAFSCKYILESMTYRPRLMRCIVTTAFAGFTVYFIGANYYNFLGQTMVQKNLRQTEAELIKEITHLHDQGHHIYIFENRNEHVINLVRYFHRFSPRFDSRTYDRVVTSQPGEVAQPYYTVSLHRRPLEETIAEVSNKCNTIVSIVGQSDQRQGFLAYHIASLLRMSPGHWLKGPPHWSKDGGVARIEKYHWAIRQVSCSEAGVGEVRGVLQQEPRWM